MTPEKSLESRIDEAAQKWMWGDGFHSTKDESFKAGAQFILPLIEKARCEGMAEAFMEAARDVLDSEWNGKILISVDLKEKAEAERAKAEGIK